MARYFSWPQNKTGPRAADLSMLIVLQRSFALRLALQQAENVLLGGIGLSQHCGGRLLHDLVFGQVCGF